jgi:DNA-binding XRE family transcriptional regulator
MVGPGPQSLGDFRTFCLHEQRPAEARAMAAAARQLRGVRQRTGFSRPDLAARLGVGVEVVVAIENGYGCLATAQPLVERARRLVGP